MQKTANDYVRKKCVARNVVAVFFVSLRRFSQSKIKIDKSVEIVVGK